MIPMMMMMMRPTARIKATRSWNQPAYADRGEPMHVQAKYIRDCNTRGKYVRDFNGNVITTFDGLPDSAFSTGGQYFEYSVDIPWQDWMDLMLAEDDVCYAYLGVETNRPSAANGGYELHIKSHTPAHGRWENLYWATQYKAYRPYKSSTGSYRIVDIHEVDGACTLTMIDTVDGTKETVTATMLTNSDDLSARPTCQTGNVAAHYSTVDTTKSTALKLAGHVNEPICEVLKIGGSTSDAYDPAAVRTRWNDGRTWNATNGYWATCYKYGTNYYGIEYSEGGELKLKAVPVYDYLTKQAGFMDEASPTNRLIFSQGRRPFKPIWDDGIAVDTEVAG